jgi:SSS family transporter
MPAASPALGLLDWIVIGVYFGLIVISGIWLSRRETRTTGDYFLGGGRIPAWAAAVSLVATSMSAASFIGVPQQGYLGDLTYLSTNLGMLLAAVVIAVWFIPAFYRARVQTIYEYLGARMGPGAGRAASLTFMVGRVFASGARIYIGAIPASLILFGDRGMEPQHLVIAIAILSFVGVTYTLVGGVASVIWSDVIQMAVLLGACVAAIVVIALRLDAGIGEAAAALATGGPGGGSKLTLLDFSLDPHAAFSFPAAVIGFAVMGLGSYGTDQDLVQRLLTCRDAKAGARSILIGIVMGIPSVALFLLVGLLLWLFYQQPALIAGEPPAPPSDSRQVFLSFIMEQMPQGLAGVMMAGLFAAGLSSLNSAINAMSSTFINDFYRKARPAASERSLVFAGRVAVVGWGVVLGVFASLCVWLERAHASVGGTLLTFALTVMTFAYAGLVGVFLAALFTRTRGNTRSAIAALVLGFVAVGLMQPMFWSIFVDLEARREADPGDWLVWVLDLAFVWKLTVAAGLCTGVCLLGRSPTRGPAPGPQADDAAPNAAR